MINGSQTGKRQSSYRHNIHVNCWYNVSVTLGNQEDVHDDVLSILLLLLRIFLWKPTGISYFCLGIENILPLLNQNYLHATTCLSKKAFDCIWAVLKEVPSHHQMHWFGMSSFRILFVYSKDHFVIWSKHWICLLELLLHRNKCIDCFS